MLIQIRPPYKVRMRQGQAHTRAHDTYGTITQHFLKNANRHCVFEVRFEIRSLKLPFTPDFSLIHQKQRNNDEFPLLQLS